MTGLKLVAAAGWCAPVNAVRAEPEVSPAQKAADLAAWVAAGRVEDARRQQARAAWFSAILEVAGPVGRAILETHVPGHFDDCEGDGFDLYAGLSWPCHTVLIAANAAGIPAPEEIW
jgi:hypothetical protein